jgi:SpoVK/Ycf46/Vps4 family AAA+-type ATPase
VLWIDELEKAFAGMGQAQDSGVSQRLFGAFLSWLEERRSSVFVVATANDVTKLPAEFARKGRFDEMFFVGLPSETERESIWRVHLKRPRKIGKIDVDRLVTISEGRTGAEIAEAVISAMYRAFDAEERPVSQEDLEIALQDGVPMCVSHAGALRKLTAWGLQYARQASR